MGFIIASHIYTSRVVSCVDSPWPRAELADWPSDEEVALDDLRLCRNTVVGFVMWLRRTCEHVSITSKCDGGICDVAALHVREGLAPEQQQWP
jgi:hypothetical protein